MPFVARGLEEVPAHRRGPRGRERIRAVVSVASGEHVVELSKGCLVGGIDRLATGLPRDHRPITPATAPDFTTFSARTHLSRIWESRRSCYPSGATTGRPGMKACATFGSYQLELQFALYRR